MRKLEIKLYDGEGEAHGYHVPLTWGLYSRLCDAGLDALQISNKPSATTGKQIILAIFHAVEYGGCDWGEERICDAIVQQGVLEYAESFGKLLAELSFGGRKMKGGGSGEAPPKQKSPRQPSK
jgi:hypothetical protein